MKQYFRPSVGLLTLTLFFILSTAVSTTTAQTPSATPDSSFMQITNVPSTAVYAYASGISGNGRFVVIESTANLAPSDVNRPTEGRNNADGNREIFLFDYAQRRIYQITDTKTAVNDLTKPAVDTSKSPPDPSNTIVEVSNNRPVISYDGKWIVFSSNAYADGTSASPASFDGSSYKDALRADGNQEIFLYRIPDVPAVDLSSGAEVSIPLTGGTFTRITFTTNLIKPQPGTTSLWPTTVDDNRYATLNDDGSIIAFVSSRNLATVNGGTNADLNSEIFVYNRNTRAFSQITNTENPAGSFANIVWNANPTLSADGRTIAFISSATNIPNTGPAESDADNKNGEIYFARFNGVAVESYARVTRTPVDSRGSTIYLSPGARISRNGNYILFESTAEIQSNGTINGALKNSYAIYLYTIGTSAFTQITQRPPDTSPEPISSPRYPTFSGDNSTIIFASGLNFTADGQISSSTTEGLNPNRRAQIFAVPVTSTNTFRRLTNTQTSTIVGLQPFASERADRIAFSFASGEFGGGNSDNSSEAFYLLVRSSTSEVTSAPVSFFSGISNRPVVAPSPTPSPDAVTGVAPGMLVTVRATDLSLAPSEREIGRGDADERARRPPLPVELNGVTVSINNSAAGIYAVSQNKIDFVVPPGVGTGSLPVAIYNGSGTMLRTTLQVNAAQPDIAIRTDVSGGRAVALNITNRCAGQSSPEPFNVTSERIKDNTCTSSERETVATELYILLTGVRGIARSAITVRIKDVDITGDAILSDTGPTVTAGFDQIIVRLPASLAGAGDVPIIVTVSTGGQTYTSRPAETAPKIRIN